MRLDLMADGPQSAMRCGVEFESRHSIPCPAFTPVPAPASSSDQERSEDSSGRTGGAAALIGQAVQAVGAVTS